MQDNECRIVNPPQSLDDIPPYHNVLKQSARFQKSERSQLPFVNCKGRIIVWNGRKENDAGIEEVTSKAYLADANLVVVRVEHYHHKTRFEHRNDVWDYLYNPHFVLFREGWKVSLTRRYYGKEVLQLTEMCLSEPPALGTYSTTQDRYFVRRAGKWREIGAGHPLVEATLEATRIFSTLF